MNPKTLAIVVSLLSCAIAVADDPIINTGVGLNTGAISLTGPDGDFAFYAARLELTDNATVSEVGAYLAAFSQDLVQMQATLTKDDGTGLPDSGTLIRQETRTINQLCCFAWRSLFSETLELPAGNYWVSMVLQPSQAFALLIDNPIAPLSHYAKWTAQTGGWELIPGTEGFSMRVLGTYETPIADSDGDGFSDAMDNCINLSNQWQTDANGDGFGNPCDADFDDNCVVNFQDFNQLANAMFTSDANSIYDLASDGQINFIDISRFVNLFLAPPGPSGVNNICPDP